MSYKFDQFTIDVDDERLLGLRGPIKLGRKALRVLLVLVAHPGRLVTKDMLVPSVWDRTIVSDSALTSCLSRSLCQLCSMRLLPARDRLCQLASSNRPL